LAEVGSLGLRRYSFRVLC